MMTIRLVLLFLVATVIATKDTGPRKKQKSVVKNRASSSKTTNIWPLGSGGRKKSPKNPSQNQGTGDGFIILHRNGTGTVQPRLSAGPECGYFTLASDTEGILYSVNDASEMECLTTVESPVGTNLEMICNHFDLNPKGCNKEQLHARDPSSGIIVSGCKREGLQLVTSSNVLEILHIRKRMKGKQCTGGFMCSISAGREPIVTGQCGNYELDPDHFSVIFSNNNGGKRKCNYNIKGAQGTTLQMICPVWDMLQNCKKEKLILKDNASRKKKTYCWDDEKPDINTVGNSAKLMHKRSPLKKKCSGGFLCFVGATTSEAPAPPTPGGGGAPPPPSSSRPFCSNCGNADISVPRIVGGSEATPGEYPFIALVKVGGSVCGGSLIKKDWVVTASHCFVITGATDAVVYLGAHNSKNPDSDPNVQRFDISTFTNHPDYDEISQDNDITLIYLGREATFNNRVQPICLGRADDINAGDKVVTAGWGVLQSGR
ncbi:uncharacterized protein [Palaemon carinicauda]